MTVRPWITGASLAVIAAAMPAHAQSPSNGKRVDVTPYIGVDQVVLVPLKGGGDVLTYTNVTAGVAASVQTRRVEAAVDLQYNHSFGWGRQASDQDVISGIANANVNLARGLALQAGGLASRVRTDGLSGASTQRNTNFTSQVWAGYVGPSYTTQLGDLNVNASYRLGYARVNDDVDGQFAQAQPSGSFADSWTHSLMGSVGFSPDTILPGIGLMASAGYDREDASQLDQRFEDVWGRVDATVPVTPTLALVGGVGYENIKISQRSPELDADGVPLIRNGRYVTDDSSPRALIYEFDDIIWDAGVLWRPSRRTTLQARVGERYGGMTYQGSFLWQGRDSSIAIILFDGIDSFGRMITGDVAALSGSNFDVVRNPFTGDLTGCAFSTTGGGQCFNDALSGITDANFRYRGVSAQYSLQRGRWGWGLGAGYSQRKFITPNGQTVLIRGSRDENWFGNASATYTISSSDSIDLVGYANYFDASGDRPDVLNYGAFSTYNKGLSRRLSASASLGLDSVKAEDFDTIISAMGQVGLRYAF